MSACGNCGDNIYYPAAYNTVIGIGSHNDEFEPSEFSSVGNGVDLLFKGENIKAVSIKNAYDYEIVEGTSYSAALVTSYAAAALENYPELLPYQMRYLMRISCNDICDEGYDEISGYGVFEPSLFYKNLSLFDKGEISCFSDVKKEDWYFDCVCYAEKRGLISGVSNTEFAPDESLTRAMLVTILWRNEQQPEVMYEMEFDDTDESAYYFEAVRWAASNNIVSGYSETEFAPNENITREQLAVIMYRYAQYKGYDTIISEDTNILSYNDYDSISEYAIGAIQYAVGSGLMHGSSEMFLRPKDNTTRAEAAAILQRFIEENV